MVWSEGQHGRAVSQTHVRNWATNLRDSPARRVMLALDGPDKCADGHRVPQEGLHDLEGTGLASALSCTEPREAPGGRQEKVWAVKLGVVYLRGELRWAPVHKGCCLGRNGWFMRKVPAVLWV